MPENEENIGLNWLTLMGLTIGEQVVIIPRGGQPGQGFQGYLVEVVFGPTGPLLLIIQDDAESARVNIPWDAVLMVTLPNPEVEAAVQAIADQQEAAADISVADLQDMVKAMGMEIPPEIQALLDADVAEG